MRMMNRVRRDDRGAVLVVVAAFTIVAVVFLAFVIDIGNQRQDRRQLTTATDAAALDVAERWANESLAPLTDFVLIADASADPWVDPSVVDGTDRLYDCTEDAQDFLDRNREVDPNDYACRAQYKSSGLASVVVFASGTTDYVIGPAIGANEGGIGSTSSVRISAPFGGGVRPFMLCASQPAVNAWYSSADAQDPETVNRITVGADKFLPAECGENNGNWGFIQFESQANGASGLADAIENGTDDEVASFYDEVGETHRARCLDDYGEQHANYGEVTCLFNETGSGGWNNHNTDEAFDALIGPPPVTFSLPIYDRIVELGPGQATGFPIVGFAEVRLVSYVQGGSKDNSVTLDFVQATAQPVGRVTPENHAVEICDVGTTGGAVLATWDSNCHAPPDSAGNPPPVDPEDPCVVESVDPASQTAEVDSASALTGSVNVTVIVEDADNCETLSVSAVSTSPAATADAVLVSESGNEFVFSFPAGTTFAPSGTTFVVEVSEGGSIRDDSATVTTVSAGPECVLSISPATQAVATENSKGKKVTSAEVTWSVTSPNPSACGVISGEIRNGGFEAPLDGPTDAVGTMTFTLPQGTTVPNSQATNGTFDVLFFSGATPTGNAATLTT